MSDKGLEAFLQAVLDDSNLQEQLKTGINDRGIETSHELADLAVEIGKQHGYGFSSDEAQASISGMINASKQETELTEAELDRVAGGIDGHYTTQLSLNDRLVEDFKLQQIKIQP